LERLLDSHGADPQIADRLLEYWDAVFQARYPQMAGNPVQGTPSPNPTASSTPAQLTQLEFASLDDASVIPGMTPAVIRRLRPLLTALPSSQQRINANTAPPEVLRAIVDDDETVSTIVSTRGEAPLTQANLGSMLSPLNRGGTASRNYAGAMLGVTSSFFLVHASGVVNPNPVTGRGGIGRSATMLVRRTRRNPAQSQTGSVVPWTLTQLDWQKEGGAALFQAPTEERAEVEELAGLPRIE
jgi:type II secretory pathway component PulK